MNELEIKGQIFDLEKKLFKYEYMSDRKWLEDTIHDKFLECGKSGYFFYKEDTIDELMKCDKDRDIEIFNYEYVSLSSDAHMVHYITKSGDDLIYRTSIWVMDGNLKLVFYQASKLNEKVNLIKY